MMRNRNGLWAAFRFCEAKTQTGEVHPKGQEHHKKPEQRIRGICTRETEIKAQTQSFFVEETNRNKNLNYRAPITVSNVKKQDVSVHLQ